MSDYLPSFKNNLEAEGKSAFTIESYISDMEHFRRWLEETPGDSFRPESWQSWPTPTSGWRSWLPPTGGCGVSVQRGWVTVLPGKGERWRRVPSNLDARTALVEYLETYGEGEDGRIFLGQRRGCR
jgi:site-specific recombinase XerC